MEHYSGRHFGDKRLVTEWRFGPDPMGSDHYPVWIRLSMDGRKALSHQSKVVDWDAFRQVVAEYDEGVPVARRLCWAAQAATRLLEVDPMIPTSDKHLINLWAARERIHKIYLANGRRHNDLLRVRNKTAQARRYAKQLARSRWFEHCET